MDKNRSVRFQIIHPNVPKVFSCFFDNPPCKYPGWAIEFTHAVCEAVSLDCKMEAREDKNWTGLMIDMENEKFDINMPTWFPTASRMKRFDFADYAVPHIQVILTRVPKNSWKAGIRLLMGFEPLVLCLLLVSCLIVAGIVKAFHVRPEKWIRWNYMDYAATTAQHLVGQTSKFSGDDYGRRHSLVFIPWLCMCLCLTSLYSGNILANIMQTSYPFHDIAGFGRCLERGECELITKSMSYSFLEEIRTGYGTAMDAMRVGIAKNPPVLIPRRLEYFDEVKKGVPKFRATIITQDEFRSADKSELCEMYTIKQNANGESWEPNICGVNCRFPWYETPPDVSERTLIPRPEKLSPPTRS